MKRRMFLKRAGVVTLGSAAAAGGGYATWRWLGERGYRKALNAVYRPAYLYLAERALVLREIARFATMAPNSHNTQPWRIGIEDSALVLRPDFQRRCPVVDPDDHHLFVSLGCAAENAVRAAAAFGFGSTVAFEEGAGAVRVDLSPGAGRSLTPRDQRLFDAIPKRQSTRRDFDGGRLTTQELKRLESAGTREGVKVMFFTDSATPKPFPPVTDCSPRPLGIRWFPLGSAGESLI